MSSIPKLTATLALGLIVLGVGCVKKESAAKPALDNRAIASDDAMDKLALIVRSALHREKPRKPTKPSKGAKRRRLEDKRRHSEKKSNRRYDD